MATNKTIGGPKWKDHGECAWCREPFEWSMGEGWNCVWIAVGWLDEDLCMHRDCLGQLQEKAPKRAKAAGGTGWTLYEIKLFYHRLPLDSLIKQSLHMALQELEQGRCDPDHVHAGPHAAAMLKRNSGQRLQ